MCGELSHLKQSESGQPAAQSRFQFFQCSLDELMKTYLRRAEQRTGSPCGPASYHQLVGSSTTTDENMMFL